MMNSNTNMNKSFLLLNSNDNVPKELMKTVQEKMSSYCEIPKQLTPKQFFEYINMSKNYNIFNEYRNSEDHISCYKYSSHGIRHADNVSIFAYYIAEKEKYTAVEIYSIMEAARYHDIGRTNDWEEGNHGFAGAEMYHNEKIEIQQVEIVKFLIAAHDLPRIDNVKNCAKQTFSNLGKDKVDRLYDMANIIRDADALDRTRFNVFMNDYLNPKYLTHNAAKEIIEIAQILNYKESK